MQKYNRFLEKIIIKFKQEFFLEDEYILNLSFYNTNGFWLNRRQMKEIWNQ